MKVRRLGTYFLLVCSGVMLWAGCRKPTAGYGDVSGLVTALSDGAPLEGVSVIYGDSVVFTSSYGEYAYMGLPDGLQGLRFRLDGFYPVMSQISIPAGGSVRCDVQMDLIKSGWAVGRVDSDYGLILYTADGGRSWIRQGGTVQVPAVNLNDVCAVSDQVCWIVGDADTVRGRSVILRSSDAGANWTLQGQSISGLSATSFAAITAFDSDTAWAVAADTGIVIKTVNGGSTWRVCRDSPSAAGYTAITVADGRNIWCCGTGADGVVVEHSSDGGTTWTEYLLPGASASQQPLDICAVPQGPVYLCGANMLGVQKSEDGGASWTGVVTTPNDLHCMDVYRGTLGWAAGTGSSVVLTSNAFETSREQSISLSGYAGGIISSLSFLRDGVQGALSVVSSSGMSGTIYYTSDGGNTWVESTVPFEFSVNSLDFSGGTN